MWPCRQVECLQLLFEQSGEPLQFFFLISKKSNNHFTTLQLKHFIFYYKSSCLFMCKKQKSTKEKIKSTSNPFSGQRFCVSIFLQLFLCSCTHISIPIHSCPLHCRVALKRSLHLFCEKWPLRGQVAGRPVQRLLL